jgi:hypothetical protein
MWVDDALHEPDHFSLDAVNSLKSDYTGFSLHGAGCKTPDVCAETIAPTQYTYAHLEESQRLVMNNHLNARPLEPHGFALRICITAADFAFASPKAAASSTPI